MQAPKRPRRNHYIPKFLLDRFSSRRDEQSRAKFVWQFSRGREPSEISTRNVGVGTNFYGKDSSDIEISFSREEGRFSDILRELDSGRPPGQFASELRRFIWLQSVRTLAIREQFGQSVHDLFSALEASAGTDESKSAFQRYALNHLEVYIKEQADRLPSTYRKAFLDKCNDPSVKAMLGQQVLQSTQSIDLQSILRMMNNHATATKAGLRAAESGQLRGLQRLLNGEDIPGSFNPSRWRILRSGENEVMLGDFVVMALGPAGQVGALIKFAQSWREVYVPISSQSVLVALTSGEPELNIEDVNAWSAATSNEFMYAGRCTEVEISLAEKIGGAPLMSEGEMAELIGRGWSDLS